MTKVCGKCKKDKPIDSFWVRRKNGKVHRQAWCKPCASERRTEYFKANREKESVARKKHQKVMAVWYREILSMCWCKDCGEDDIRVLCYDHVRGKKKDNVSNMIYRNSKETVLKEVAKCEVRCLNCHAVRHHINRL